MFDSLLDARYDVVGWQPVVVSWAGSGGYNCGFGSLQVKALALISVDQCRRQRHLWMPLFSSLEASSWSANHVFVTEFTEFLRMKTRCFRCSLLGGVALSLRTPIVVVLSC